VLPLGFGALDCHWPPHDGFLFLAEPLDFLLDSEQLLLLSSFIFEGFFLSVLQLDLLELDVSMDDLYQQRCPQG
jgi:hypothetical protein